MFYLSIKQTLIFMAGYGVELEDGVSEYTARKCICKDQCGNQSDVNIFSSGLVSIKHFGHYLAPLYVRANG